MPLGRRAMLSALPLLAGGHALAQAAYPERPVTIVAPFSAGGASDLAARLLIQYAPPLLAQPAPTLVVENRTGASGAIGTSYVQRAKPDGYTLLLARVGSSAILPATDPRTPYAWDEFSMLGLLDENPFVICVRAEAPWRTLGELVAALRDQPGRLNFATTGPATILDLGVRQLFVAAGLPIDAAAAVPFRGGGEAVAALVGGQVQFIGNNLTDTSAAITQGQLRALVVSSGQRLESLPGVPTAKELDLDSLQDLAGWNALFGPPELPAEVMQAWEACLQKLAKDRDWLAAVRRLGGIPKVLDPGETRLYVGRQVAMYRELAKRLGLV
jgi:tripartite-type tricarboxylate transporter receptor subunit TctC